MQKINPQLFETASGDTAALLANDKIIDSEVKKLNNIELTQLFLPAHLRFQRFKD